MNINKFSRCNVWHDPEFRMRRSLEVSHRASMILPCTEVAISQAACAADDNNPYFPDPLQESREDQGL